MLRYYSHLTEKDIQLVPPAAHPNHAVGTKQTVRASVMFFLVALFTIPVVVFAWGPINHENLLYAHLSLAFATVVQAVAMWEFFPGKLIC